MNLFGYPATQDELYQAAIRMPLDRKIAQAIALIQEMERSALNISPDGYYVCFSGGKDSVVMAELFHMAGVKYTMNYNITTIDPPELIRFMRQNYPDLIWHRAEKKTIPQKMVDKSCGPPTRIARWCCEIYKEHGGDGLFKAIGVRAVESKRRKGLWKQITKDDRGSGMFICPIVYWSEMDVWKFIKDFSLPYCSLYDEGFKRLGCIGCPLAGPKNQALEFKRWPRYEALWKRGFQAYWDTWKGVPRRDGKPRWIEKMESVDELWDWWISSKAFKGKQADCQGWLW